MKLGTKAKYIKKKELTKVKIITNNSLLEKKFFFFDQVISLSSVILWIVDNHPAMSNSLSRFCLSCNSGRPKKHHSVMEVIASNRGFQQ